MRIFGWLFLFLISLTSCDAVSSKSESDEQIEVKENPTPEKNVFLVPEVPDSVQFVGEWINLEDLDLKERFDRELIVNNFWHSNTILYLKRAHRWFPVMRKILTEENVPEDMLFLAVIESGLVQATSPSGAKGFWQFLEPTAREYGLIVNNEIDERLHVEKSTRAACKYLKSAYLRFNSWYLAAASYNMGKYGVSSNLERQGVERYFNLSLNDETARYVFRIMAVKEIMNNPEKFGFQIKEKQLYPPYETEKIIVEETIENLYDWSIEQGANIKIIRKLNPWIKGNRLTISTNEKLEIYLPANDEQLGTFKG